MTIQAFAERLQPRLDRFLDRKITEYGSSTLDPLLSELFSYPKLLLGAGGKRVRPYVAALMFEATGGTLTDEVIDVLMALELFHLFALIHDDVIDRGAQRHGVPTVHVFTRNAMQAGRRFGDIAHVADGQAVLVGDLVFSWACEAFERGHVVAPTTYPHTSARFRQMIDEVVVGQMIDVDLMTRTQTTLEVIERKMLLKTASYTFIRPMQIGMALGGGDARLEAFADAFGRALGIAYQIQDDLFDLVGSSKNTKKTVFSDITDRQHTLFTQHVFTHGSPEQQQALRNVFGTSIDRDQYPLIRSVFEESGAIAAGTQRMEALFSEAQAVLAQAPLPEPTRAALQELVQLVMRRTS